MSAVVRKKQDSQDKYLSALRELVNTGGGNRSCFDCGQKGPTYVNMQIGSFVCTRCSGVLRGLTPPHRVKSISMATFTQEEIDFLKAHGNDDCAKTWLGLWDPKRAIHQDQRELMIDKYERKRYYLEPASPLKSLTNAASLKAAPPAAAAPQSNASQSNGHGNSNQQQHTALTNGHKASNSDVGLSHIQLTPPTSQRTTANGLQHHKSSSSAISRPQHSLQNGFNHHPQNPQQDAFMLNGTVNGNGFQAHHGFGGSGGGGSVGSTSTGAMSDTSSCASNGFGPDADFVADFGSADIFNATSAGSVGSPAVSSASSVASSNGYAKIQPLKAARPQQQQQFMNGHANGQQQLNGTSSMNGSNGNAENFADFDHAPIYNAAANYQFISKSNLSRSNAIKLKQRRQQQLQQQQNQRQQSTRATTMTTTITPAKMDDFFNSNDFDFIRERKNSMNNQFNGDGADDDDDVVGTLAAIIGNGNNRNNMRQQQQQKPANIIYSESTSNFNDPFADFSAIISSNKSSSNAINSNQSQSNRSSNSKTKFVTFESDFDDIMAAKQQQRQQQHQQLHTPAAAKFTPLAMAAHATAMAVLGSDYHFNKGSNYNKTNESKYFQIADNISCNNRNNNTNAGNNNSNNNNKNNQYNAYRNPFDAEQWDVWQESSLALANETKWPTMMPSSSDDDSTNYNTNSSSIYLPLTEFKSATPQQLFSATTTSATNWLEPPAQFSYATPATPTTHNPSNNFLEASSTVNNNNNSDASAVFSPQSMSLPSSMQSSSVDFQQTSIFRASEETPSVVASSSSLMLSSYPSTNPFRENFSQESFTNCDNSCTTLTTTTPASPQFQLQPQPTPPPPTATTTFTATTDMNTTAIASTFSSVAPLEVFARNDLTSTGVLHNPPTFPTSTCCSTSSSSTTTSSTSFNSIIPNANFNSNFDSNRLSSGGWRAIPIPNGNHKNSFSSSNNNHKLSSTPSEDRYAALKDLDEQLRESKAVAATAASVVASSVLDSFGNNNNNLAMPNAGSVNPFKSQQQQPNPFQIGTPNNNGHHLQQPQQQHQQQQQQNIYGQLTVIPNGMPTAANGFGAQQTPPQPTAFFNYSNGFTSAPLPLQGGMSAAAVAQTTAYSAQLAGGPNGCGFGFGTGVGAMSGVGAYVNPFAASGAMNTNNPFL